MGSAWSVHGLDLAGGPNLVPKMGTAGTIRLRRGGQGKAGPNVALQGKGGVVISTEERGHSPP